ncbi:MAG: hypothetical protein JXR77_13655 [Lentisphaeria bacterium]|nr:hypothetical protein [Lentisphaeria bacterium]
MSKDVITQRLVTTRRFAPGEGRPSPPGPDAPVAGEASADELLREEEESIRKQSAASAWIEVRRRRGEVLVELDRAIRFLEHRRQETEQMLRTLSHRRSAVTGIDVDRGGPPVLSELRRMKQDLHDAHVELTMFQRIERGAASATAGLADMTLGELSRLGFGLFWPLILALLAAAAVIAVGVQLALTV